MSLQQGDLLQGRYHLGSPLGHGGMGTVFLAHEVPGAATLVVKQLRLDAPELLEAFRGEFAILSRLSHPHLARVLELGSERVRGELVHYYVAEHVAGATLGARAREGASPSELLRPVLDALEGLSTLHDARIRHGDFTLENVLVRADGSGVLIDLGCARAFGSSELLSGTDGYLAPELLAGAAGDARADLFAAGVTLKRALALSGRTLDAVQTRVIDRLLRAEPEQRPMDVSEVLQALGRRAKPRKQLTLASELLGRERELEQFGGFLEALLARTQRPRVCCVAGESGVGVSRFAHELCWRAQLLLPTLRVRAREAGDLPRQLARALGSAAASALPSGTRGALSFSHALADLDQPTLLVVEDYEHLDSQDRELLFGIARLATSSGPLAMLLTGKPLSRDIAHVALTLNPLDLAALRRWTRGALSERRLRELLAASRGLPAKIANLLQEGSGARLTASELPATALPELPPAARRALSLICCVGGSTSLHAPQLDWAALEPLFADALLERDGDILRLSSRAQGAFRAGALADQELREAHRTVAEQLAQSDGESSANATARLIRHWTMAGDMQRAEELFLLHEPTFRRAPRSLAEGVSALFERSRRAPVLLLGAELLLAAGQPRAALRAASRLARSGAGAESVLSASLFAGDALVRLGRPARAELLLRRVLSRNSAPESAAKILQRLARAQLARGDYAGAKQVASRALAMDPKPHITGLLLETLGVALAYSGELEQADSELSRAHELLGDSSPREQSRLASHRGMVLFRRGQIEPALFSYGRALAIAEEQDQDDLIATGLLNLGTAEQQAGQWSRALAHYERGMLFARAIGRLTTESSLQFNLANLYSELGAFERAEQTLTLLAERAEGAKLAQFKPAIALVRAEIYLAQRRTDEAHAQLLEAEAELQKRGQPRELFEVRLRRAETAFASDDLPSAAAQLEALSASAPDEATAELRLGLEVLRGRLESKRGDRNALARLESARLNAERAGFRGTAALITGELALAALALGDSELAAKHEERARRLWDRIAVGLSAPLSAIFWEHPRRVQLTQLSRVFSPSAAMSADAEAYRRLLSLNRRLNSSLSVERVLEYAVQAAVDLTGAERGFLVLRADPEEGEKEPRIVVQRSTEPDIAPSLGPSRSIVLRTLEREEAVLTTDAQGDARFVGHGSVHALRLKSVLSVPVLSPSGTLGVLYVDSRVQRARFSERERDLLSAFADQLAIALGNARLHADLEQKTLQLAAQTRAIEQLSKGQARQIERLEREVSTQRQNLELRYDYSQIIGRGPAMRRVLERLDRVIESEISVLVLGESGTGKELVARAVHFNGARKAGPFQGINCAALPEGLLESELFGSVKGAFTGADRDKTGLMLGANGGTLFLDEVGELPLPTQAKLLRVLQEREVRPVGADKALALDIRLVCATHRDLQDDVASGRFREDLYYRIAVVSVELPPLRERLEDLAELSTKILAGLARAAQRKPPELTQEARRVLAAHRFPGNVRELQNVLTRAFVLATGPKIQAKDVDLGGTRARAPRGPRAGSRRDFEAEERERILEALRSARWNVSVVARTLGIPRNTLYRKLTRYGIARDSGP